MKKLLFVLLLIAIAAVFVLYRWPDLRPWAGGEVVRGPDGAPTGGQADAGGGGEQKPSLGTQEKGLAGALKMLERDPPAGLQALEEIVSGEGSRAIRAQAAAAMGRHLVADDETELEGFRRLSQALRLWKGPGREAILRAVKPLTQKYFLTPEPTENAVTYRVKSGDVLSTIAEKQNSSVGLIKLANRMRRDKIYLDQELKVPRGPVDLLVDKKEHRIMAFADGCYLMEFSVGLGLYNQTPEGFFTIKTRLINPAWYKPGEPKPIPHGHPDNILGTRWLGFKERPTIGIHGIRDTEGDSIGKNLSAGCVRMHNRDVEMLFEVTPAGSKVEIRR